MNIGYFITRFPYRNEFENNKLFQIYKFGGAEIVAYNLANQMAKKGHNVKVFTTSYNSKNQIEEYENLTIYRYGTNFKIEKGSFSINLLKKPVEYELDIIHTHFSTPPADIAALIYLKYKKKIPSVVTYHGDGQTNYGNLIRKSIVYIHNKYFLKRLLKNTDIIISPSESYINESKFLKDYRNKIQVIPNGVNIKDFEIEFSKDKIKKRLNLSQKKVILFVGALINYKGPDVLIKSMQIIIEKIPDVKLVFVGEGIMKEELEKLSIQLGLKNHVEFVGFVGGKMKSCYYKSADIFCLPSTLNTEVFPLVLLEASASGLPLVVSDLDTFKCILEPGHNGVYTKKNNEKSLAEKLLFLLENDDERVNMGNNARERVEVFNWNEITKSIERLYEDIL